MRGRITECCRLSVLPAQSHWSPEANFVETANSVEKFHVEYSNRKSKITVIGPTNSAADILVYCVSYVSILRLFVYLNTINNNTMQIGIMGSLIFLKIIYF